MAGVRRIDGAVVRRGGRAALMIILFWMIKP
jgi:hypothetical protein